MVFSINIQQLYYRNNDDKHVSIIQLYVDGKKHSFTTGKKISAKWSALSGRYLYYRSQDYNSCGYVMQMESHTTKKQITEIKSDYLLEDQELRWHNKIYVAKDNVTGRAQV
jgi:hypothetical protein